MEIAMGQRLRVHCINKIPRQDPYHRITHIGGLNADRTRWRLTEDRAIQGIKDGTWEFYVQEGGVTTEVVIAKTPAGHEYLKTEADKTPQDNLLNLTECPQS